MPLRSQPIYTQLVGKSSTLAQRYLHARTALLASKRSQVTACNVACLPTRVARWHLDRLRLRQKTTVSTATYPNMAPFAATAQTTASMCPRAQYYLDQHGLYVYIKDATRYLCPASSCQIAGAAKLCQNLPCLSLLCPHSLCLWPCSSYMIPPCTLPVPTV